MGHRKKSSHQERLAPTLVLAGVVLLTSSIVDAYGGLLVRDWAPVALVLAALALVASLAGAFRGVGSRWGAVALGLLAAYTAWTFASLLWSPNWGDAWWGAGQTLLYLLAFWLSVGLVSLGASRRWALAASAVGPVLVAAFTLPRLAPDVGALFVEGRLTGHVLYYNGLAAFLLVPFWAAVYLGGSLRANPVLRGAALGGAVLSADVAVLTQSRGAMVAIAASLPVFFLLSGQRLRELLALAPVVAALALAFPGLNEVYAAFPDEESARAAVERVLPTVWLTAAGAGLYGILWGLADRRWVLSVGVTRVVGGEALAGSIAVLVLGAAALSERVGEDPVEWGEQNWEEFKTSDPTGGQEREALRAEGTGQEQGRYLTVSGSGRYNLWQVAWEDFASHPLLGVGTHNYEATFYRLRDEPIPQYVRQPHSLPLEVLAERGVVGGVLFFGFLAVCLGAGLRKRFGSLDSEGKAQVGAMTAAVAYWFVHSGAEWFWQQPAVTLPAVIYLGMLAGPWQRVEAAPPRWPVRAAGAGVAVLAVAVIAPLYVADHYHAQSRAEPDAREALAAVERAQRFGLGNPYLRMQEAQLAALIGDWDRAEEAHRDAIRLHPGHYRPYELLAEFYDARGDPVAALSSYQEALALNPLDPLLNQRAIELLGRAPVRSAPVRFVSGGAELGRLSLTVVNEAPERDGGARGSGTLPPDGGLLFAWPADTAEPFRTQDAATPSDVAFVGGGGEITEIRSVIGPDEGPIQVRQPYRLVIEANRGFFESNNIRPGSQAVFAASP